MRRKSIALLLGLLVTAMSASACSQNGGEASPSSSSASPSASETSAASPSAASPSAEPTDGPLTKYGTPINVSLLNKFNSNISDKLAPGDTIESNIWTRSIAEDLGINITYPWVVANEQYVDKLNVTLASGSLPDIMLVHDQQFKQLSDAGLLADLTDVFDKYATDLVKSDLGSLNGIFLKAASVDGKQLGLPLITDPTAEARVLWVRMDWLEKLGLPEPQTMDDVIAIAKAFANDDPDGDGKQDTYGLALNKDLFGGFPDINGFFNGYHAYSNSWGDAFWYDDGSGKLVNGSVQPETKTALGKLQELYKAGAIDREFGTKDGGMVTEDVASGKLGLWYGDYWNFVTPIQTAVVNDPNAKFKAFSLPSADGEPAKASVTFPLTGYWVVKKDFEHPEALIKLVNYYYEKKYGAEGKGNTPDNQQTFFSSADGKIKSSYVAPVWISGTLDPKTLSVIDAIKKNDPSGLNESYRTDYDNYIKGKEGDASHYGDFQNYDPDISPQLTRRAYADQNRLVVNAFYGPLTKTMESSNDALKKLQMETFTRIIMGSVSIDEFDKYVENWNKLGGDKITEEVNAWYATNR
ncbi:extracellular solute-binding protein [Cohnella fermenti]|uniref:Extracellular solute-binding protein n=1 Tax=Cohnella fermenti TaxID=2565925 RepID=A0A4S4BJJ4_9BACL|nr:extracellular solute-binding protein [Cohnella fermenti]THF74836.1 extracellular solute-binding protein [Cohnella fermenti]